MKMFLTRIGFGSKCVVTGDVTQIDVAGGRSGLVGLEPVLGGVEGIAFVHLTRRDVVRHKIVADIVDAYEDAERRGRRRRHGGRPPMAVDVFAADEQTDRAGRPRPLGRAGPLVLEDRGVKGDVEVSLLFVDEATIAALNEQFLGHDGPDRRAGLPDRGRAGAERPLARLGWHRARGRARATSPWCCWATWSSARRWPPATPSSTASPRRRDGPAGGARPAAPARAWTTRTTPRPSGWRRSSASCWPAPPGGYRAAGPSAADGDRRHRVAAAGRLGCLIAVIVVLLAVSGVLALAETSLVRTSRVKAKALAGRAPPGRPAAGPPGRAPRAVLEPGPAAGAHLPAGLGHPGRRPGRAAGSAPLGGLGRHRLRGGGDLRPLRGGAEELGRAQPRAGRPVQRPDRRPPWSGSRRCGPSPRC